MQKNDIKNRSDIEQLVVCFYDKIKTDKTVGYIFIDIAKVNWEKHLPLMFNFWENVIFFTGNYNGNPVEVHQHLHTMAPLTNTHFKRWNELFTQTVDELFEGSNALLAKQRALNISIVLQQKILKQD